LSLEEPQLLEPVPNPAAAAHVAGPSDNQLAVRLRGFGPLAILVILLVLFPVTFAAGGLGGMPFLMPFGAMKVLAWVRLSRTPWHEIGYVRPKSWITSLVIGVAIGVAFKLLMKAVVMPLLGADPINHAYHFLAGNREALFAGVWSMVVTAGWGEETLFHGFLFERLGKLLGPSAGAKALIVLATSLGFALLHYSDQGLAGAEQAVLTGLIFGTIFAVTGRLFMPMCAHAAFDLTAIAIIYLNLESKVAHLVFR
jgi:membrane protease YdiL (CAAX protease family)